MFDIPVLHPPTLAIRGRSERFPVRRIYCVGQNYPEHAREMGADPTRQTPFFFCKPADAVVPNGGLLPFPCATSNLHHEVELVVALRAGGSNLQPEATATLIFGAAVGIDLTRRDLQNEAKKQGRPWDMAKGFDHSAPIGLVREGPPPAQGAICLSIGGCRRQQGDVSQMIWPIGEILAALSTLVTLAPGDLIFTGTPPGVGPISRGDHLDARIEGLDALEVSFS